MKCPECKSQRVKFFWRKEKKIGDPPNVKGEGYYECKICSNVFKDPQP